MAVVVLQIEGDGAEADNRRAVRALARHPVALLVDVARVYRSGQLASIHCFRDGHGRAGSARRVR